MLNKRKPLMSARQVDPYDKVWRIIDYYSDYLDNIQEDIIDQHLTTKEIDLLCSEICKYLKDF